MLNTFSNWFVQLSMSEAAAFLLATMLILTAAFFGIDAWWRSRPRRMASRRRRKHRDAARRLERSLPSPLHDYRDSLRSFRNINGGSRK